VQGFYETHNKYLLLAIRLFQEIEIPFSKRCERAQLSSTKEKLLNFFTQ
jgi:hypothetical protein